MGYYLYDHPPASRQYRSPRRENLSGVVVVHTAENVMDSVGPDTGAENVSGFISRRSDPGSYHEMVDSDSDVLLLPEDVEAFHVATDGHNRHSFGVSIACRSQDLNPDEEWTQKAIVRLGTRIRQFWERNGFGADASARWISRDQAIARNTPGLVTHGALQPIDRSDAWTRHPRRVELEQMLVDAIRSGPAEPTPPRRKPQMISLVTLNDGRLCEFYARPADGRIIHRWQPAPNEGPWSPWALLAHESGREIKLPGAFDSVSAAVNEDGRCEIIAWHSAYLAPFATFQTHNGGNWVDWYAFP